MASFHPLLEIPEPGQALPGRVEEVEVREGHLANGRPITPPFPVGIETVVVGMGCFWGAERVFWSTAGVWVTAVGYSGGQTPNPTYQEVCSGLTGHAEVVLVAFDPEVLPLPALLGVFWENHDPTQGMAQGNDVGTQYRSGLWVANEVQRRVAEASRETYTSILERACYGSVTTEVSDRAEFFYAEDYHQQYLVRNPNGYCGLGGTGISCPVLEIS